MNVGLDLRVSETGFWEKQPLSADVRYQWHTPDSDKGSGLSGNLQPTSSDFC